MTGYKGPFRVKKWKWYLVDLRDWHHPVIVRKHFETAEQALIFKKKYATKDYDIINGFDAIEYGLRDWEFNSVKHPEYRHSISRLPKYDYPPHITDQYRRQIWRMTQRRGIIRKQRKVMELNYKALKEIWDHKEILFFKRLKKYRGYYQAYSRKMPVFKEFKKHYQYPRDIVRLCAIYMCLKKYYDVGLYDPVKVAILIYDLFPEKVSKWLETNAPRPSNEAEVKKEFLARGFVKFRNSDFIRGKDAFVETILITPTLVYPIRAWHTHEQLMSGVADYRVYELQSLVGIQGYTRSTIPDVNR